MTLGQRIKQARLEKGFTQKELSEKLGLSETYVSQYERDMRNPKPESLKRIADALDIPVSALDERLSTWDDLVRVAGGWMSSKEAALAANISADELSLICAYRQASLADKQIIDNITDRYSKEGLKGLRTKNANDETEGLTPE